MVLIVSSPTVSAVKRRLGTKLLALSRFTAVPTNPLSVIRNATSRRVYIGTGRLILRLAGDGTIPFVLIH